MIKSFAGLLFCATLCFSSTLFAQNPKHPAKAPAMQSTVYCHQVAEKFGPEMQATANKECKTISSCVDCTEHDTGAKTCVQLSYAPTKASGCLTNTQPPADSTLGKPVAGYRKTACLGKCPVYIVTIYANGVITWEGIANVQPLGQKRGKIDNSTLDALREKARSINFLALDDVYPAQPPADAPTTILFLELDGKSKQVVDIFGAPAGLKELQKMFEALIKKQGWTKPAPMQKKLDNKPKSTTPGAQGGN